MWQLKKGTAESIVMASRSTYPNEFISLLGGSKAEKTISELVVLPAVYGRAFSSLRLDLMPIDFGILGSVHSHPSRHAHPSSADLDVFLSLGEIHLIIAYPFNTKTMRMFDRKGNETEFKVVE